MATRPGPTIFVLYGATGDLAKRMVLPAFSTLSEQGLGTSQQTFRSLDPADVVVGQFDGYRRLDGVASRSRTATYVAAKLWVDTPRWRGVPFLLRTDSPPLTAGSSANSRRPPTVGRLGR